VKGISMPVNIADYVITVLGVGLRGGH
jgi:hypothetical protein